MLTNNFTQSIIEAFCALISVNYGYRRQPDTVQLHLMVMTGHYMAVLMDAECMRAVQRSRIFGVLAVWRGERRGLLTGWG
jgi:hypothetical protein